MAEPKKTPVTGIDAFPEEPNGEYDREEVTPPTSPSLPSRLSSIEEMELGLVRTEIKGLSSRVAKMEETFASFSKEVLDHLKVLIKQTKKEE